jgi:hypothetical protein
LAHQDALLARRAPNVGRACVVGLMLAQLKDRVLAGRLKLFDKVH